VLDQFAPQYHTNEKSCTVYGKKKRANVNFYINTLKIRCKPHKKSIHNGNVKKDYYPAHDKIGIGNNPSVSHKKGL
jgi:hypothetical protein